MHFDWSTLVLQTINVLILVWLLRRFLFGPVTQIIATRRATAQKLLADAAQTRAKAQQEAVQTEAIRKSLEMDAARLRAEAHAAGEADRAALVAEAEKQASQRRAEADTTILRERETLRRNLEGQAAKLAVSIASRLLDRASPSLATAAFIEALEFELTSMPQPSLSQITSGGDAVEIATALPLSSAEQGKVSAILARRLTPLPPLRFRVDPSLIAGIELRGSHCVVRNSWRADLERIAQELQQESGRVEPALA